MPAAPNTSGQDVPATGSQAVIDALLRCGITCGFGIPSIHNIALYEGLRNCPQFHHWVVRHEQAAGFAADAFSRAGGGVAAVFASTGPGNLFTLVPLLESLQSGVPVLVIGTNIASSLLSKTGGALHETPNQIDVFKPLTRFARRVSKPDEISETFAAAGEVLRRAAPGPAFIEIPHDFLLAPLSAIPETAQTTQPVATFSPEQIESVGRLLAQSRRPVLLVGAGARPHRQRILALAENLQSPILTTTSGKGIIPDDHLLAFGCISRLGAVQEVLDESDLLISFGARLTEFDTGRFGLRLPAQHLQLIEDAGYAGDRLPASFELVGPIGAAIDALAGQRQTRVLWCDLSAARVREKERVEALKSDAYAALVLLRGALGRDDVVVNDQSILNYWASAFFPVFEPGTFLYPLGSGTLGYGLPAGIGAACALRVLEKHRKVVCIAGDGGFQYTQHELATLVQYDLPVKILVVNDEAYGVIGFLQRSLFGQAYEVALKNPDFCRVAEAYGIRAERVTTFERLRQRLPDWLESPGPALLEWRTELKAPWEIGAIPRPTSISKTQG
jgi:thiamine pyrophosphate-dependent acetolactate synthase large subunit-like protein